MSSAPLQVLLCVDLRLGSQRALGSALQLLDRLPAELAFVHIAKGVEPRPDTASSFPSTQPSPAHQPAEARLMKQLAHLGRSLAGRRLHVRQGRPLDGILHLIGELRPDLVVVCSHERVPFRRPLLGSVSRGLAGRSPVPILVIPPPD